MQIFLTNFIEFKNLKNHGGKMNSKKLLMPFITFLSICLLVILLPVKSHAVPSFARSMELNCSACHTQWPLLNDFGRDFLAQGFDTGETLEISDMFSLQKPFPFAARFNMRPIDKRFSNDSNRPWTYTNAQLKLRALHEFEAFIAGRVYNVSYFAELEAEDEWPDPAGDAPGFQIQLAEGFVGWHVHPMFNIRTGLKSPFVADGRNTVHRAKPGRYQWSASSKGFLPGAAQFIAVSGDVGSTFYSVAWHGNSSGDGQLEGNDPYDFSFRLAHDLPFGLSLGGYLTISHAYKALSATDRTDLWGFDIQFLWDALQFNAIYGRKNPEEVDKRDDWNLSLFGQYIFSQGDSPFLAFAVNLDRYTEDNAVNDWTKGAFFLTYFFRENVKVQVGWEGTYDSPRDFKESRATLVIDVAI